MCVFARGGREGERDVIEVTMVIQFQQPPTSLRLSHPHFLTRTKKQIFLRGIPSVAGAAAGFTNWSKRGLGERVPRRGSLLRYASSRICWAQKLHKTMLISGILSILWNFSGWKSLEWKWSVERRRRSYITFSSSSRLFWAVDEHHHLECKCQILCILWTPVKGNCLA